MLSEHSQTGIRLQLQTLWTEWVAKTCDEQLVPEVSGSLGMEAATPPDSDDELPGGGVGRVFATAISFWREGAQQMTLQPSKRPSSALQEHLLEGINFGAVFQ